MDSQPEWTKSPALPGDYVALTAKGIWIGKFTLPEHSHLLSEFQMGQSDFFGPLPPVPAARNASEEFRQGVLDELTELQERFRKELNQLRQRVKDYRGTAHAPF